MGIYDRDYYRERQPGLSVRAPRSVVVTLIVINVALYLANGLLTPGQGDEDLGAITESLAASDATLTNPLLWWQFVTYGFVHSPSLFHILFNMLQLWFLGRAVEDLYGCWEFLRLYLVMLVVGSLTWAVTNALFEPQSMLENGRRIPIDYQLLGASGAVQGIVMLFVLNFPHQTLILFPIPIPIKAWVIGLLLVVGNLLGAVNQVGNTAFGVHLAGIGVALLYFRYQWNLGSLSRRLFATDRLKPRPKLRVHRPPREKPDLTAEVDRILEKIHRSGEASLTRKERRVLEDASREYQRRQR